MSHGYTIFRVRRAFDSTTRCATGSWLGDTSSVRAQGPGTCGEKVSRVSPPNHVICLVRA
ncbi:uncharacterized protein CIMG_13408 [Coccidioides immitis RS]|uniref:Uncharacterized protein n=1 Tax=Coccidioides immitis (strain RS) TaxID=246410 RepID=A0A0D8JUU5_COCIM|nr:uncharacterized protein CIMG_13408 [Coccidioides immitis RS]KJF61077.1 hypothetical protein CIMG_13408 [Coccidioides immitis RS]